MKFYERIGHLRQDNDIRQKDICKIIHVAQRTYSDYESGKTRIPITHMIKLAKYYNVDMNYICGLSKTKKDFPLT